MSDDVNEPHGNVTDTRPPRQPLVPPGGCELLAPDMTAVIAADVRLLDLQSRLREVGQWLPMDGDESATVGSLVERNSSGPLRLGYGAWRDLLLGVQFLNGRGELITAGGQTVKNVAGYDLTKFMVGQAGVFGRIVTITTRTYLRPAGALHARFAADARLAARLLPTSLRPQWAMLVPDALWCGYLGDEATLAFCRGRLAEVQPLEVLDASLEDDVRRRACFAGGAAGGFRASVPPARLGDFAGKLPAGMPWAADAAFGIVVGGPVREDDGRQAIRGAASAAGGSVYFYSPGDETLEFSTSPAQRQIIERLKSAFDSGGKLHPLPRQRGE